MNTLQDRLQQFLNYEDISMRAFERQCDIKAGTASKMTEKSYGATFHKIAQAYPRLNIEWLKTGNGEMLRAVPTYENTQGDSNNNQQGDNNVYFNGASPELIAYIKGLEKDVEHLKVCLAHKEDKIKDLKSIITDKDERISELKERIDELKVKK